MASSVSNSELVNVGNNNNNNNNNNINAGKLDKSNDNPKGKWNPFEDPPFDAMTEDLMFGAEFDKIRQEGSLTSKFQLIKNLTDIKWVELKLEF